MDFFSWKFLQEGTDGMIERTQTITSLTKVSRLKIHSILVANRAQKRGKFITSTHFRCPFLHNKMPLTNSHLLSLRILGFH